MGLVYFSVALNKIPENQIHLWFIDANQNYKHINQYTSLSESEKARAKGFKNLELGKRWAYSRQALREILALYLLQTAENIEFKLDVKGKPLLKGNQSVFFNLSHSHGKAIVGISSLCHIGVDIEKEKHLNESDDIVDRFFSEQERSSFFTLPNAKKQSAFFRVWTRKEAFIKANGWGMQMPLDQFDVPVEACDDWFIPTIASTCGMIGHYYLCDVILNKEYKAALCLYANNQRIEVKPQLLYYDYKPNNLAMT